jgi:long-chain acyl-CoA synthetase
MATNSLALNTSAFTTVPELLAAQAHRRPDAPFLRWSDRGRVMTYAEVETAAAKAAGALRSMGVGPGDRVGLLAHNGLDYLVAMFGAWRLGAISAHISVMTGAELADYANSCTPKVLVYTHDLFDAVERDRTAMSSIEHYLCMDGAQPGAAAWGDIVGAADTLPIQSFDSSLPMHLSFTSGSTGRPKGAVLIHEHTVRATACIAERLGLGPDDHSLGATSPASSYGLVAHWLPGLHRGMTVGLRKAWDPVAVFDDIESTGVTFLASNPPQLKDLLVEARSRSRPPKSLRMVISGGEAVPAFLKRAYFDELGVVFCESYGQSELGGFVALARPTRPADENLGAVGEALPDKEVRVLDDQGMEVPIGEPGELCLRGGFMWGYWNEPEKTAVAVRNGWLRTGDLGRMTPSGHITTLGRYSERIDTPSGVVLPRPIEEAIMACSPVVRHVGVVPGTAGPRAVVALWPEESSPAGVPRPTADDLLSTYRTLPAGTGDQRLADIVIIPTMPMTSTGKIDRVAIRTDYGTAL